MITRKSSSKANALLPKTLTLEIPLQSSLSPPKGQSQAHKIRKSHQAHSPRMVKIENALESIELDFLTRARKESAWSALTSPPRRQGSSFLAYKLEQSALKALHANKTTLLKNKFLLYRQSPEARERQLASARQVKSRGLMGSKRKLSFITLNGFKSQEHPAENHCEGRKRAIYIKTAEGKRQKISEHQYLSKIQEKSHSQCLIAVQSLQLPSEKQAFQQRLSPVIQKSGSKHERLSLLRHIRTRSLKKDKKQVKIEDCRPWSSSKSQFPNLQ